MFWKWRPDGGAGFPEDGVTINAEKTAVSFDCPAAASGGGGAGLLPRRLWHDGGGAAFLPWCGLLINTATLDIQVGVLPILHLDWAACTHVIL